MECFSVAKLSIVDFADYLEEIGLNQSVVSVFEENKISGATFLQLTDDDLRELVPVMGYRVFIRQLLRSARQVYSCIIV